jgi:hypothetical protein
LVFFLKPMQFYCFKNGTKVPLIRKLRPVNENFVLHITSWQTFKKNRLN